MTDHKTREEWLAVRLELLEAERPTGYGQHGLPGDLGRNETGIWFRRNDEFERQ
jgi:hypothetical protein